MALLTLAELREHVETDLGDAALQRLLDAEEAAITARAGAIATATERWTWAGTTSLVLSRPAATITSITEGETLLDVAEYVVRSPYLIDRASGTWGGDVTVVYEPVATTAERTLVLIQLVTLALAYSGYASRGEGDYREQPLAYTEERERILSSLGSGSMGMVFA